MAVRKVDGVESIDVSLEKAAADIRLKPNNHVTLAQLRAAIKKNGYATRDAQVEAHGKILLRDGKPVLDLLNGEAVLLASDAAGKAGDRSVDVTGVAHADPKGLDVLTVTAIR